MMFYQGNSDNGVAVNLEKVSSIEPQMEIISEGFLWLGLIPLTRSKWVESKTHSKIVMDNGYTYYYNVPVNELIDKIKKAPRRD